jgi:hypothetical protein
MVTFTKFNSFVEALAEKKHNLGSDQLKLALSNTAPAAANTQLSDITEITYTNLSTRNLTTGSSAQTSGTYKLVITDLTLTSTGGPTGPFRYFIIYNDTATNDELVGYYDYGQPVTLADGESFAVNFDDTNGLLQIV